MSQRGKATAGKRERKENFLCLSTAPSSYLSVSRSRCLNNLCVFLRSLDASAVKKQGEICQVKIMGRVFVTRAVLCLAFIGQALAQEALATAFIKAVRKDNPALLKQWLPTPALVRTLEPAQTKGLSEVGIKQRFLLPSQKKLTKDFANFRASAQRNSIDRSTLWYDGFQLHRDEASAANRLLACTVNYFYGDKRGAFTITVLEQQAKWYLFEVLLSVNIFDKLK